MSHFVQAAHRLRPYHIILERCIPSGLTKAHNPQSAEYYPRKLKESRDKQGNIKLVITHPEFASFFQEGLSNEELEDNVNVLIAAGADSTITTLSSLTYYLIHNPECYERLKSEIKNTFQAEDDITLAATRRLHYLGAAIKETMRIHPPVPVGLHRVTPKKGSVIDGRPVPGGVRTVNSPCLLFRTWHWGFIDLGIGSQPGRQPFPQVLAWPRKIHSRTLARGRLEICQR